MKIDKRKKMKLSDVISFFKERGVSSDDVYGIGNEFNLYREPSDELATEGMICYIDDIITFDDGDSDDIEIYPNFAIENNLELYFTGELFLTVMDSVLEQKKDASISIFVEALNFYEKNDNFLDIE